MNLSDTRRFAGIRFGLSISTAPDMPGGGDPDQFINSLTFRIASSILLEGGSLVLGHRWSSEGIMEHLTFQARDSRGCGWRQSLGVDAKPAPSIHNIIAWPDAPPTGDKNADRMIRDGILEIRQVLPPDIPLDQLDPDRAKALATDLGKFARIRALTAMRQEIVRLTDARICLGGEIGKPTRRLPGLIEEALLTCQAGKPLCISSALGGAARAMADAILHRRMSDDARAMFFTTPAIVKLFGDMADKYPAAGDEGPSTETGWNAFAFFQSLPLATLSRQAGLSEEEYVILLTSTDVQRVLGLAMTGILRLRTAATAGNQTSPAGG
jgi:hypothetical protein